jgi:hypothetical protein
METGGAVSAALSSESQMVVYYSGDAETGFARIVAGLNRAMPREPKHAVAPGIGYSKIQDQIFAVLLLRSIRDALDLASTASTAAAENIFSTAYRVSATARVAETSPVTPANAMVPLKKDAMWLRKKNGIAEVDLGRLVSRLKARWVAPDPALCGDVPPAGKQATPLEAFSGPSVEFRNDPSSWVLLAEELAAKPG